jgi:UDP-N-acetylglucosamine:LPS N-acetylglucosamine transferase
MKIKVLHVIPNFGCGGAERLVIDLLDTANKARFEMAVVSLYPESGSILDKELKKKGINVFYLNKHIGFDIGMFFELYHLFRSFRPDVVHTHLSVLRYTLIPTIVCRIPVGIHTMHNVAQKETGWLGKLVRRIAFGFASISGMSSRTPKKTTFSSKSFSLTILSIL